MLAHRLVHPVDAAWRLRLDGLARDRAWLTSDDLDFPDAVASLSDLYNTVHRVAFGLPDRLAAARLGFFLPRDVPKGAAAVRELLDAGLVADRPLRILDLGAGLGAMTLGAARALRAAGFRSPILATLIDRDPDGLAIAAWLAGLVPGLAVETGPGDLTAVPLGDRYDLVLVGNALAGLDAEVPEADRVTRQVSRIDGWLSDLVADDGALVLVEPALREPTRHLHRLRDGLLAVDRRPFAPCTHAAACPMLHRDGDWCHERLDVPLPAWLVPIARAARLRSEGGTFAYLVLRPDNAPSRGLRVVSEPLPSKGRHDLWLCGEFPEGPARKKVGRLDRHASEANTAFAALARGEVITLDPPGDRVGPDTTVRRGGGVVPG